MTIIARAISWVSEVGEPFSFMGDKGEPVTLHPVYAKVAETEVCQIFKTSADAALEVRGILIENMDRDVFLDVEDTGKVSAKGNKKWKLMGLQPPGEGEFIDLRKIGKKASAQSAEQGDESNSGRHTAGPPESSGAVESPGSVSPLSSGQVETPASGSTSESEAFGEGPSPSGTKYADRPAPADWTIPEEDTAPPLEWGGMNTE